MIAPLFAFASLRDFDILAFKDFKAFSSALQFFKTSSNNCTAWVKFSCKPSMVTVVNSADALTVKLQAIL